MQLFILDTGPLNQICFADRHPEEVETYNGLVKAGLPDVVRYEVLRKYLSMQPRYPVQAPVLLRRLNAICNAVTVSETGRRVLDVAAQILGRRTRGGRADSR